MSTPTLIRFGFFELHLDSNELRKRGRRIKVPPKPMQVLVLLVRARGRLVSREALRQQVWGEETFVDFEHALNFSIRKLRAALGDSATKPKFIETLPRQGYRFIATIDRDEPSSTEPDTAVAPQPAVGASPDAVQNQAYEYYAKARRSFSQVGRQSLEEARDGFERALELDPNYAMAHSGLGATYSLRTVSRRDAEELEKARVHLTRALELDPEIAEPYPWLCYVYMRLGATQPSIDAGRRAIQLQPDLVHGHYFLGLTYFAASEVHPEYYQSSADHLMNATRVGPQWQPSWFVLALLALLNGDYSNAERFARHLIDAASKGMGLPFIGGETVLASLELRRRNTQAARQLLVEFLERLSVTDHMYRDSMTAHGACGLGDVELRDGNFEAALAAYRRAWHTVQEHPRMIAQQRIGARAQAGLASVYALQGELDRALALLARATQAAEEHARVGQGGAGASLPELFLSLTTAYAAAGDGKQALVMLKRSVRAGGLDAAWLDGDPMLRPLRSEPEFAAIVNEVRGFPRVEFGTGRVDPTEGHQRVGTSL